MVDNSKRIDDLKKELARDSRSRQFYQLGELLRRDGRLNEAAEVLRGGLKHHARYVAAWVALGRTCLDLGHGRESEAADALTQALGLDAHNPVAWRLLGEARLACGQRGVALEAMERALALVPGDEVLKAAVEALQAEGEPQAQSVRVVERRPDVPSRAAPPPVVLVEPLSSEAPFAFEAAPLEIEAAVAAAEAEPRPPELEEGVGAAPVEPGSGESDELQPLVAVAEAPPPALVDHRPVVPIEAPFRDEVDAFEAEPTPALAAPVLEAIPSIGAFNAFDVFDEPPAPAAEVAETGASAAAPEPVESPSEAWGEPIPTLVEPVAVADLEQVAPGSPEVGMPLVEVPPPQSDVVVATAVQLAPEPGPESATSAVAEPVAPAEELSEAVLESIFAVEEVPVEVAGGVPGTDLPEEDALPAAPDGDLPAEPGWAAEGAGEVEAAAEAAEPGVPDQLPAEQSPAEAAPPKEAPAVVAPLDEPPASMSLARLYLRQQQMDAAVEVLDSLLKREPDNQEARDLLLLVRDMMEEAPALQVPALSAGERKIAALQRWLVRVEHGRERMAP